MLQIKVRKINKVLETDIDLTTNKIDVSELAYALYFLQPGLYFTIMIRKLKDKLSKDSFELLIKELDKVNQLGGSVKDQIEFRQAKEPMVPKVEIYGN